MRKYSLLLVGENKWLLRAIQQLIESDLTLEVCGTCIARDVMAVSKQLVPDVVLFFPEISLISSQPVFFNLQGQLPRTILIFITPVEAALYDVISSRLSVDGFVTQGRLNTDLLPKIRTLLNPLKDTESHEQR